MSNTWCKPESPAWYLSQDWFAQFIAANFTIGDQAKNENVFLFSLKRIAHLSCSLQDLSRKEQTSGNVRTNGCRTGQPTRCLSCRAGWCCCPIVPPPGNKFIIWQRIICIITSVSLYKEMKPLLREWSTDRTILFHWLLSEASRISREYLLSCLRDLLTVLYGCLGQLIYTASLLSQKYN